MADSQTLLEIIRSLLPTTDTKKTPLEREYVPPTNIKDVFVRIEKSLSSLDVIMGVFKKLAEYPITDLVFPPDTELTARVKEWKKILLDQLDFPEVLGDYNLNYILYGNTILTPNFETRKVVICPHCREKVILSATPKPNFEVVIGRGKDDHDVRMTCSRCSSSYGAKIIEELVLPGRVNLIMWDLKTIDIQYNNIADTSVYVVTASRNQRLLNPKTPDDFEYWLGFPIDYIRALVKGKSMRLDSDKVFHMRSPILSSLFPGWGIPILYFALRKMHHMEVALQSQENLMKDHFNVYRYVFPNMQGGIPGLGEMNLAKWSDTIKLNLQRYRLDPLRVMISPIPIGSGEIGGKGKMYDITPEIQEWTKQLIATTGAPLELAYGGLSWSGSNVSLRILENTLLTLRKYDQKLIDWVIKQVAKAYPGLTPIEVKLSQFRMAEDVQRKNMAGSLYGQGLISATTLMAENGFDLEDEIRKKEKELVLLAKIKKKEMEIQAEITQEVSREQQLAMMQNAQAQQQQAPVNPMSEREKEQLEQGQIPTAEPPVYPPRGQG